jgi:hypothetical protein
MAKKKYKYEVYWEVTIDGEAKTLKLPGFWESKLKDPDDVKIEIDEDPDLMGFDFEGYPEEPDDLEIVWEGYPIVIPVEK